MKRKMLLVGALGVLSDFTGRGRVLYLRCKCSIWKFDKEELSHTIPVSEYQTLQQPSLGQSHSLSGEDVSHDGLSFCIAVLSRCV